MPRLKSQASTPSPETQPTDTSTINVEQSNPPSANPVQAAPGTTGSLDRFAISRPIDVDPPGGGVPFVQVCHPSCRRMQAITRAIPKIREGDVVVVNGETIRPVLRLHMLHGAQYWAEMAPDDGQLLEVSRTRPTDPDSSLAEHIESLILAYTSDGILAAKATWRKTRAPLAKVMVAALQEREGLWFEFTGTPRIEDRTSRDGIAYKIVTADIAPINADDARLLQTWLDDENEQKAFARVKTAYEQHLTCLDAKAE
jgi:hypothetical protein